jgi:hypothetical protein
MSDAVERDTECARLRGSEPQPLDKARLILISTERERVHLKIEIQI